MLIWKQYRIINFTGNLDRAGQITKFFIIEEAKETILGSSQRTMKVLWIYFALIKYQYKITQNNTLNVNMSSSQLIKLKSEIKNGTQITLNFSSNVVGDSSNETIHKLSLTNTQVSKICKAFVNNLSANIKLSKI